MTTKREYHSACIPNREPVMVDLGDEPSMTRQEFAKDCDINVLMQHYEKNNGVFPLPMAKGEPQYLDCTAIPTNFHAVMDQFLAAEDAFMSLSATVRKEFGNDPMSFVEFATKPENLPKLREWGLAPNPEAPAAPLKVEVVNPAAAVPAAPAHDVP